MFYESVSFNCAYLPNRRAKSSLFLPGNNNTEQMKTIYSRLIHQGFRRNGEVLYRPSCNQCHSCLSSRIITKPFRQNKNQQRIWRKNSSLNVSLQPLKENHDHSLLYHLYQENRHDSGGEYGKHYDEYIDYILTSRTDSFLLVFQESSFNEVKIVSVMDRLEDGLSAVYTFYDTTQRGSSLGVYAILYQIRMAALLKLPYLYLGYWVPNNQKMKYKLNFQPLELLTADGWISYQSYKEQNK